MPYIKQDARQVLDKFIQKLGYEIAGLDQKNGQIDGYVNYAITTLVDQLYSRYYPNYDKLNRAIGVFEAAKLEFYRRRVAPYEDKKIKENGDVY